jgi:thiol-disulfide isomerase/thioredoxin
MVNCKKYSQETLVTRLKIVVIAFLYFFFLPVMAAEPFLTDIDGMKIPFSQLKGKWVLLNYWASWCQPCLDEITELNTFYRHHKKSIALYAINFDNIPIDSQLDLIKQLGIRYPSLSEDPRPQLGLEHVRGVPATFVFDPEGHLSTVLYGAQTQTTLSQAIHQSS